jgi:hypothetical protein
MCISKKNEKSKSFIDIKIEKHNYRTINHIMKKCREEKRRKERERGKDREEKYIDTKTKRER